MKFPLVATFLLCIASSSCSPKPSIQVGYGDYPEWISSAETLHLAERMLASHYTNARIESELGTGRWCIYRFTGDGAFQPKALFVDRKCNIAFFDDIKRIHNLPVTAP